MDEVLEAFERCQRCYPTVQLSFEVFQARVDEILSQQMPIEAFAKLHHEDLFLALACARGDRVAWEHFADDFVPILRRFAMQACGNSDEGEDLAQEITAKMLGEKNRLAGYNGRGSLAGWLRVAVSHAAIDRFRRRCRQIPLDDLKVDPAKSDEAQDLDAHWGPIVSTIVQDALARLAARDRLLLGLYYLRGSPLKDIGRLFRIHEATASRWLEGLRRKIRKRVERELRTKHGLRPSEIPSLWRWVTASSVLPPIAGSSPSGDQVKKSARRID
jgi:RNA polymerase sigma-70 factor (ECF subfamily)